MNPNLKEAIRGLLPRRLKAHRIRRGPLAGQSIYTSWHDYPGAIRGDTELPLLAWFEREVNPGQTWLDVGAHYGYTGMALAKLVGATGRVFAFEPVPSTAGCIARTRELNRLSQLRIVPLGLSAEPGIHPCALPVYRGMADSTLGSRNWEELLFVAGFDSVWESLSGGNQLVHGVKIDVQGMEAQVLAGMAATLRRFHPKLIIEFHADVDRIAVLELLTSCGYNPSAQSIGQASANLEDDRSYAFSHRTEQHIH